MAAEQVEAVQPDGEGVEEMVGDKGVSQRFPAAPSTACQGAGGRFDGTTEVGRAGQRVSQEISDHALVRAFAGEKADPPAPLE